MVGKAELYGFGAVGHGTAPNGDDQVGAGFPRLCRRFDHCLPRRMRWHAVENAGATVAEFPAHLLDLVGLACEGATDNQENTIGIKLSNLFGDRFGGGSAE